MILLDTPFIHAFNPKRANPTDRQTHCSIRLQRASQRLDTPTSRKKPYISTEKKAEFCQSSELCAVGSALAEPIGLHWSSIVSVYLEHSTQRIRRSQKIRTTDRINLSKALRMLESPD